MRYRSEDYKGDTVTFHNYICPFATYICTAKENDRCLPIDKNSTLLQWQIEAEKRAKYCHYRGLLLTMTEATTHKLTVKKANQCKYLML